MGHLWSAFLLLLLLCVSAGVGFFVNAHVHEKHKSAQSIELVQVASSLLVTFVAIVLGFLINSVKLGFDAAYNVRGAYAAQLVQLDRCLRDYGPQTRPLQDKLRSYVAAVIASTWPSEPAPTGISYPDISNMQRTGPNPVLAALIDDVGLGIRSLDPPDELHRRIIDACEARYEELTRRRWAVVEGLHGSITTPFYWVLNFWLIILFGSFGLRAPPNKLAVIIIGLCAISVASAVFVILDLDVPYGGLFGIPSDQMRNALADMMG